ncbi:MAG TPA: hypothetical protein VFD30_14565 [Terriglobia bacterium]|nr:hypothetical protein [Terriglobia bacterium]
MNKGLVFWILSALILLLLSLVYLNQGLHRKNPLFTYWLCLGVIVQLLAGWALAAGQPNWLGYLRTAGDLSSFALTMAVLIFAAVRREEPVNRTLLMALGGMLALNILGRFLEGGTSPAMQAWLRNIAFFGPALYLLTVFSNVPFDRLPLWVKDMWGSRSAPIHAGLTPNAEALENAEARRRWKSLPAHASPPVT